MVETVSLREVARIDRKSIAPESIATGSKYVGLENIESGGRLINVGTVANGELASSKFEFTSEHVLYGKLRPYLAKIALPEFDGICSTDIVPVLPSAKLDRRYLVHFLRQPNQVRLANSLATGANLPRLSPTALGEILVPLLPVDEQRRIAAILDKVDELRAKCRQALLLVDALGQSIFHNMFGTLSDSVPLWPRVPIGEACTAIVDCVNRTAPLADGPTPYKMIRTSNVRNREIDLSSVRYVSRDTFDVWNRRATPQRGDIVLTREAPMGEAGQIAFDDLVFLGQRTMLYRPNPHKLSATYLLHYLTSDYMKRDFERHGSGSTVKHLSVPYCRSIRIHLPPVELQNDFARRVAAIDRMKARHRSQLTSLDALFASLQHRAFNGGL